jgi:hypothetical protein
MLLFLVSLLTAQAEQTINFPQFLDRVENATFGSEQILILETLPQEEDLRCNQVTQLIEEFSFSADQLKALEILAPHIQDPQNSYIILDSFTFSSDKEKAQGIITQNQNKFLYKKNSHQKNA